MVLLLWILHYLGPALDQEGGGGSYSEVDISLFLPACLWIRQKTDPLLLLLLASPYSP